MIYIHTGKVTGSKYCTFGSACFYLSDIPIRDIPYSFFRTLMPRVSPLSGPEGSCRRLYSSTVDAQRLLRLRHFLRWLPSISDCWIESLMLSTNYSAFNQWSLYSVSPHSDQARLCQHLCSVTVDAQHLSSLGYCLRNSLLLVTGFDWM